MSITVERLRQYARMQPDKTAVIDNGDKFSYGQFYKNLQQYQVALKTYDLNPGDLVAVEWGRAYSHWLALLACESLGLVTFSYSPLEPQSRDNLPIEPVLQISGNPPPSWFKNRHIQLSAQWLAEIFNRDVSDEEFELYLWDAKHPLRIQCSSGTTGQSKYMMRDYACHRIRIQQLQDKTGYTRESLCQLAYGFAIQATFGRATACLEAGGTIVSDTEDMVGAFFEYQPTHIALLPGAISRILNLLPADFDNKNRLTLSTFGGKLSASQREACLDKLTTRLIESYGINETGSISTMTETGLGKILPDVTVEVLDESHQPVLNQEGFIRIRSAGLVEGYINDPVKSAEMFKDGWFYPGDWGVMPDSQHLKILGRKDDLLNFGGIKFSPLVLEEQLRHYFPVQDICLITLTKTQETENYLALCYVADQHLDQGQLATFLKQINFTLTNNIHIFKMHEFPYTSTGKIQRHKLSEFFEKQFT